MSPSTPIPVTPLQTYTADVLVVGAGTAGIFAAIAAAKSGADTLLVEKNGLPGGTVTAGGVDFPGLFHAWGKQIVDGPCYEAIKRCEARGGATIPPVTAKPAKHWMMQIRLDPFTFLTVVEEMLEEAHVRTVYHAMPVAAEETPAGTRTLFAGKSAPFAVSAGVIVDCTGDANVLTLAGCPMQKSAVLQPATLIHDLGGYRLENVDRESVRAAFAEAYADGRAAPRDFQGRDPYEMLVNGRIDMHIHTASPETSEGRTVLEKEARAALARIIGVYRTVPGLEALRVTRLASECGVRESLRIDALTNVTSAAYLAGKRYDDAVCYAFYPIDRHTDHGIAQVFLKEGVVPTVPYTALIPKGKNRMLTAGRCIGADTDAISALRVQAVCMATGQAAGCAAALVAREGLAAPALPVSSLRRALLSIGAICP